jgi:Toprim domain
MSALHFDLRTIARALGGEVCGGQVLAPGPYHSPKDRSLSVRLSPNAPDGFIVSSFAGNDWRTCRDYVRARLGIAPCVIPFKPARMPTVPPSQTEANSNTARARQLWSEARDPRGTVVQKYLATRALQLFDEIADAVVRYHPRCPWREDSGTLLYVPAMLAAMRTIDGDDLVAVHRTRLNEGAEKLGRRMLGAAAGAAIKLDADAHVTHGLTIGEGLETCLTAWQLGFRPTWALASIGAIKTFPVLAGIEALTILTENDANGASARGVTECASRWCGAGREVVLVSARVGNDLNDAIRGAA